ncbi:HAUS augmin-like complex subunit 8 [Neolamprologus brichardi]|uniref:HAUS augmin-like complex subunit 8 n=1 Tax=Neolamprologus brichardi TaxID=32507 RepID=UPI001643BE3A|nr:HAUS augmin-like complex subunit 8 [Neolamprologus brichardi]
MASRRATTVPSSFKSIPTDSKSSKSSNPANKANNVGSVKKTVKSSGTVVKSRYLQSAEKTSLSKSNSLTNESITVPRPSSPKPTGVKPKAATPTRRSMAPYATSMMSRENEASLLGRSVLQSTFSDNPRFRPDLDISVIKDRTVIENAVEPERNAENEKMMVEMETFLLAYLTAKMESNTAKLKAEAETKILQAMEEEQSLHDEVKEKKCQYLLAEKKRLVNELLDLQIKLGSLKSADKAVASLKESEKLLLECTEGDYKDNSTSLECLRDIKVTSKDISQQLSGAFKEQLELSSLVCRQRIYVQQSTEEEQLGSSRSRELYCPKH